MLVIRMQRTGRSGHAQFRVVVQDSRRTPTSGKIVAALGSFDPHSKQTTLDKEKAQFYLDHGAQPSPRVVRLLKAEGVKLPAWVSAEDEKKRSVRNADKRRSTRPPEPAEETPVAEAVEEPAEAETPEANAEAPAKEVAPEAEPAETTEPPTEEAPTEPATEEPAVTPEESAQAEATSTESTTEEANG